MEQKVNVPKSAKMEQKVNVPKSAKLKLTIIFHRNKIVLYVKGGTNENKENSRRN